MNKYNIDEFLFYSSVNIMNITECRIILCKVKKIEKVNIDGGHFQIIYTVKFVTTVNFKIKSSDKQLKSDKELSEECLYRDINVLKLIHDKSVNKIGQK